MFNIFGSNKVYTCNKHNYTGLNSPCPDCQHVGSDSDITQYNCSVKVRQTIYEYEMKNHGNRPKWLIMTDSFYRKLIYELSLTSAIPVYNLANLCEYEGISIAVIPSTHDADLMVTAAV
jgi:hypothetical protein